MLTESIESHVLELHHIPQHGFLGRRGKQPVRPPSLVKRAELEKRGPVEGKTLVSHPVLHFGHFPHGKVAFRMVHFPAF